MGTKVENEDNCYQISDDDCDENEGSLIEEITPVGGKTLYERAWSTNATRALIHVRGPMEERFCEGRHKRTTLWLYVARQMQKLGFQFSAAKVQKKWHNILITYNKNINKKYNFGYVHWEFFEEMYKYLQGKKAYYEKSSASQPTTENEGEESVTVEDGEYTNQSYNNESVSGSVKRERVVESFDQTTTDFKRIKYEQQESEDYPRFLPEISHDNGDIDLLEDNGWWKEYFDRKLQCEKEKIELQREMHKDIMNFNKMSIIQQEKIERIKIDAINNLTSTLQKFIELKNNKRS